MPTTHPIKLTAAQSELVNFLRIDEHLVEVAAQGSGPEAAIDFAPWIASMPAAEKNRLLLEVIEGKEHVGATMLRRYEQEVGKRRGGTNQEPDKRRTAEELMEAADRQRKKAEQATRRQKGLERQQAEAERQQRLTKLSKRVDGAPDGFRRRIKEVMTRHSGKSRFIRQLRGLEVQGGSGH